VSVKIIMIDVKHNKHSQHALLEKTVDLSLYISVKIDLSSTQFGKFVKHLLKVFLKNKSNAVMVPHS